jgi:uncharacterized repeat protein (TIGR01451 family)
MTASTTVLLPPRLRRVFAALIFILAPAVANATTYNLTASAPTTNWSDVTKWNGGTGSTYPGQGVGDVAIIGLSTFNMNIDVIVPNGVILQISSGGVAVDVPAGSSLQIEASSSSTSSNSININGGQLGVGSGTISWGGGLNVNTGTLALTGTLSNITGQGSFAINGGTVSGPGTLKINASSGLAITGTGGGMNIDGAFIDNFGTISYTSNTSQSLSLNNGAHIKLESASQFNISGNDPIQSNNVGGPAIDVFGGGNLTKSGGTGTTQIDPAVNNAGTVMVVTGRLNLYGGGTHTGVFSTATGGDFMGFNGTHALQPGTTASGGGVFELVGGNFNVNTAAATPWAPSLFTQSGGTLAGTGTIRVTSTFTWTGGTQSSAGTTELTGTTNVNGGFVQLDTGRVMSNSGTFNYAPTSGFLTIDGGAHIDNTGTIDLQNDAIVNTSSPATSYILTNGTGLFKKSGGTFSSVNCSMRLNGQATLRPAAGMTISLGGGTGTGTFGGSTAVIDLTGASSEVYLAGGTFVFAAGSGGLAVNGTGELRLANAVLQLTSGPLAVSNFVFDGAGGLLQSVGPGISINGAGGTFTWDGGTIDGLGGGVDVITVNGPTGTLSLTGSVGPMIMQSAAHIKNVGGTIDFNPLTNLSVNSGSVIDNAGGTFAFNNNNAAGITTDNFGNPLFSNSATVSKAANPNTTQVDVKFNSTTTVTVSGGTLRLMGGGTDNGAMTATNAADRIEIGGGTYSMAIGATLGGSGTFAVNAGAVLTNTTTLNATNFELAGTVNGGGNLTINNGFKWLSGGFSGPGAVTTSPGVITNATALTGSPTLADGFTFINNGIFNYNPTFSLTFNNSGSGGATFNNNGVATFDIQGNGITIVSGAGHSFANFGTVKKSAGAGGFTFTVPFSNQGSGSVQEQFNSNSTIAFNATGSGMSGGSLQAASGGNIDFTGGDFTISGGSMSGAGGFNLKGATLTVNVPQTLPPNFTMSTGLSTLNGTQTIDVPSGAVFSWSGGTITGGAASPITILSGGILHADTTASALIYDTRPLAINLGGNFNWTSGANPLIFQNGAAVSDSGAFNVSTNGTLGNNTAGSFSVAGTFAHNAAGTLIVGLPMSAASGGTITSSGGGILALTNGSTHSGTFDAQSSSFLDFAGGTHTMNPGSAFSAGTGIYKLAAGTLNLLTNVSAANFSLFGGALAGNGNLDTTSNLSWSGGSMGGTGTTTVASGTASFTTGPLDLNRNLTLSGNTGMNAPGGFNVHAASTITNNSTFGVQSGNVSCVACTTASFVNNATIQKNAFPTTNWSVPVSGAGTASLTVGGNVWFQAAVNLSSIFLNGGTVQFSGSPVTIGSVSAPGLSTLIVSGGTTTVSGGISGTGCALQVTAGTLTINGSSALDILSLSGGTLTGAGALTFSGISGNNWTGGTLSGSAPVTINAGMSITGSNGAMALSRNLTNDGTIFYNPVSASQVLTVSAPASITNNGTFHIVGGFDLLGVGSPVFTNANSGTFDRSAGPPSAINFGLAFVNAGNSTWSLGTTTFTNGYSQTAGTTTLAGATIGSPASLNFTGGVFNAKGTVNGNVVINGATLNPGTSPGAVTISGNYTQSSSGVLNVELNGTAAGSSYDQVNVTGNATLDGTLNATIGYSPANNDFYDVLTIGGTRSGDFATKNLPGFPGPGTLNAAYVAGPPEKLRITATVASADLMLSVSAPATVLHGQNATVTFTITNLGASAASSVSFNDTLTNATVVSISSVGSCTTTPIACSIGTLAGGGSTNVVLQINAGTLGSITNNASVSHSVADPTPGNNSSLSTITVTPASDFGVFSVTGPAAVNAGANLNDTVTVKNGGPDAGAPNLNLSVSGGTIVSASGGGFACTTTSTTAACTGPSIPATGTSALSVVITAQLSPGTVTLSATTSSSADPNAGNNSGSASSTIGNVADVSVVKTGPPTADAGANITYNITVANSGPSDANGVSLDDPTPSRLTLVSVSGGGCTAFPCALGTLIAGQNVSVQATYTVTAGPPVTIFNLASITSTTLDPNPNNDASSAVTAVGCGGQGPTPIAPTANSVVTSPVTFSWTSVPGAIDYTVTANIGGTAFTFGPTTGTTINGALPGGSGFWNVAANFGGNCTVVPSANVSFSTCGSNVAPNVRLISEAVSGQTYLAQWDALPGASFYEVDESATADFATLLDSVPTTETRAAFRHIVTTPTPFFYRVRAFFPCAGKLGPNSVAARIVITIPPAPDDPNPNVDVPAGSTQTVTQVVHVPGLAGGSFNFTAAADQPWFTVKPTAGFMPPSGVDFTVTFDPTEVPAANGTFTGTILVTLINTTAEGASHIAPLGNTTMKAPVSISLVTPVVSTIKGAPPANTLIIPSVGHLAGINSVWRSDIRLANTGAIKAQYALTFTPTGDDASKPVKQTTIDVDAGGTTALDDIVRNWYGVGSLGEGANGVLEIRPLNIANKGGIDTNADVAFVTVVSSRTYNVSAQGTLGQFIPAIPFSSFIGKAIAGAFPTVLGLQQIAQSADFRTNLGLVEAAGKPATVQVTVFDSLGNNVFSQAINMLAGEQKQLNGFLEQNHVALQDGRIEVQVTGGDGRITAYASRVDNRSGDPLLVSGVPLRAQTANHYVVPGVAALNTGFANWQSDVRMFNAGTQPVTGIATYYPQNGSGSPSATALTINPGETKQLDNILQTLFGLVDTGGALHVTTPDQTNLVISGRTYNQTPNGTFGQFIPAVTPNESVGAGGRSLQILQAEESVRYRTNVGIAETTGKPAVVEISVFLADSKIAPKTQFTIGANEFRQLNIIRDIGLDNVYNARIQVRVLSGEGKITAYGSVVDMITQDGTYVPGQ